MYILVHFSAPFPRMGVLPTFTPLKKAGVLTGFQSSKLEAQNPFADFEPFSNHYCGVTQMPCATP